MDGDIEHRKGKLSTTTPPTFDAKNGELWYTNKKVIGAHVDAPKIIFSGPLKFSQMVENGQGLLTHTYPDGGPPTIFYNGKFKKNWPKIQRMRAYNVGARGINLTKRFHVTCREAGMIILVQRFGGPHP